MATFTLFHAAQLAFLALLLGLIVERARALLLRDRLATDAFLRAALAAPPRARAELALRAEPALVARIVSAGADAEDRDVAIEEALVDARREATARIGLLRIGATLSSTLGLIGAALEARWAQVGEHGLWALEAGRVEAIAMERSALCIALGIAGSSLALGAFVQLRAASVALLRDVRRAADRMRAAVAAEPARDGSE